MNIIVVEDDSLTALFIKESIEDVGHTVVGTFDNAQTLFETINNLDVDLAFMDIEIAGKMDGIESATILQDKYSIPCFFITSYQDSDTIHNAMGASPLGYLIKPVSETEIEANLAIASKSLKNISSNSVKISCLEHFTSNSDIKLSKSENQLLELLCKHKDQEVSTYDIFIHLWGDLDKEFTQDAIRTLIKKLRKKLPNGVLQNIYGGYYKIVTP